MREELGWTRFARFALLLGQLTWQAKFACPRSVTVRALITLPNAPHERDKESRVFGAPVGTSRSIIAKRAWKARTRVVLWMGRLPCQIKIGRNGQMYAMALILAVG